MPTPTPRGLSFFFQAEDGIRDYKVTGVQTCALPIYLRQSAYVGAMDFRHRFPGGRYQLSGSLDLSRVAGTGQAIAASQQSPVHFYQRPDGSQTFDSTRTTLMGDAEELLFGKVGGGITRFQTSYQRRSPGFEVNDLGFLLRADQQSWNN